MRVHAYFSETGANVRGLLRQHQTALAIPSNRLEICS